MIIVLSYYPGELYPYDVYFQAGDDIIGYDISLEWWEAAQVFGGGN